MNNTVRILHILPFKKEDLYFIYPFLGVSPDDYRDKYCECLHCKQIKYVTFSQSELGKFEIVKPIEDAIYSFARVENIIIRAEKEPITITFFGRNVSKIQARDTSISFTNEKDLFEMRIRDIKFNKVPEHVCGYYE